MRRTLIAAVFATALGDLSSAAAQQKDCEQLKTEIAAKLDAKGVKNYTLEIVPAEKVKDEKVVGACEGGSKRIIYKRN
jgi:uncharacterized protein DUF1161